MSVQPSPTSPGNSVALAVGDLDAEPGWLAVLGVDHHHVGDVDRSLALDHAAHLLRPLGTGHLLGALMALDDVEALDVEAVLARFDAQDLPLLAAVLAAHDDHLIAGLDS